MGKFITYDETKGRKNIAGDFNFQIKFLGLEATENTAFGILSYASLDLEANKQQQQRNVTNKHEKGKTPLHYQNKPNSVRQTSPSREKMRKWIKIQRVEINHIA